MDRIEIERMTAEIAPVIRGFVAKALSPIVDRLAALEAREPIRGEKGDPGPPGETVVGPQGRGIGELLIDANGFLVSTFSDGAIKSVGKVVGTNGTDGKPGDRGKDADVSRLDALEAEITETKELIIETRDSVGVADQIEDALKAYAPKIAASVAAVKSAFPDAVRPLHETIDAIAVRLAALESKSPESGPKGDPGKDAPPPTEAQVADAVSEYLSANPPKVGSPGSKGDPGLPGKDAEPVSQESLAKSVAEYLSGHPAPPGPEGPAGQAGKDGQPGPQGIKGIDGAPGPEGLRGLPGEPGREGRGIAELLIDSGGSLVATFTDGAVKSVGPVQGKDGKDGKDGIDGKSVEGPAGKDGAPGLGFDDFVETIEAGGRMQVRRYGSGERVKEFRHKTAVIIYRGVFAEGRKYEPGDTVTWGGSLWHCNSETGEKPGETSKSWTLATKRGRDGKDGKDGDRGPPGAEGKAGRDLTRS